MEFVQEDQKDDQHSDNREEGHEDQEEEEDEVRNMTTQLPLSFCASSSGYNNSSNSNNRGNNLQLTDYFSLKSSTTSHSDELGSTGNEVSDHGAVWLCGGGGGGEGAAEREHMFDKVVTPSDVGKLNRLVIPKQHAERYFPLDSAANEKGLLLNFEDRNGKSWRFRYSYWNSSQSYVMTKGWSRFVKEKKLDAGDIVSFERGVGESGKGHLYIDWRRRPHHHYHHHHHHALANQTSLFPIDSHNHSLHHHHQLQQYPSPYSQSVRWGSGGGGGGGGGGGLLYSGSVPLPMQPPQRHHENLQYNYDIQYPYHHHHQHQHQYPHPHTHPRHHHHHHHQQYDHHHHPQHQISGIHDYNTNYHQVGLSGSISPMVIDTMTGAAATGHHHDHGKNTAVTPSKRLRLFGVNMEYCPQEENQPEDVTMASLPSTGTTPHDHHHLIPSSSVPYPHQQVRLPNNNIPSPLPITNINPSEFSHKGKSASLSFDLDP